MINTLLCVPFDANPTDASCSALGVIRRLHPEHCEGCGPLRIPPCSTNNLDVHLKEVFRRCVSDGSCPDPSILSNFDLNEPVAQARGCQAPLAWINSVLGKENARSPSKHLIHTNAKPTEIANTFKNTNFPGDIIYTLHHFFLFLWFSKRI